jgi:hypothetical protein
MGGRDFSISQPKNKKERKKNQSRSFFKKTHSIMNSPSKRKLNCMVISGEERAQTETNNRHSLGDRCSNLSLLSLISGSRR